jgi:hypothetical protein
MLPHGQHRYSGKKFHLEIELQLLNYESYLTKVSVIETAEYALSDTIYKMFYLHVTLKEDLIK